TNHQVRSPLLNINKSCQTCHHAPENELRMRVETIQDRHMEMRSTAMNAVVELIDAITKAKEQKVSEQKIAQAQNAHREAQFLIDYVEAENSMGFHAPQEAARLLVKAMDIIRKAQAELNK
ncbi:MAG: ammonia-forming cytochrome c nitrite reductase subunit c552, partial [Candidatus Caldatribacteriota bacterium]